MSRQRDLDASLTERSGARLRQARLAKNLSLPEVAECAGFGYKSRISNYEQGLRRMSVEVAAYLGALLGVSPIWLLCLDDVGRLAGTVQEMPARAVKRVGGRPVRPGRYAGHPRACGAAQ